MQSISNTLFICFLGEAFGDEVEVCLFVHETLHERKVLLKSCVCKAFVCVFQKLLNLLVDLSDVHIYLVHIAFCL